MYNLFALIFLLMLLLSLWSHISSSIKSYEEPFVPKIVKETYRPIERNFRIRYEGFYDKTSADISNLFRKFGIL